MTESDARATAVSILSLALKPVASQVGKQLAKQVIAPDREGFDTALMRIRGQGGGSGGGGGGATGGGAAGGRPAGPSSGSGQGRGTK